MKDILFCYEEVITQKEKKTLEELCKIEDELNEELRQIRIKKYNIIEDLRKRLYEKEEFKIETLEDVMSELCVILNDEYLDNKGQVFEVIDLYNKIKKTVMGE